MFYALNIFFYYLKSLCHCTDIMRIKALNLQDMVFWLCSFTLQHMQQHFLWAWSGNTSAAHLRFCLTCSMKWLCSGKSCTKTGKQPEL